MSSKLVRQFRREMTKNPKKAGILALLGLVAVYFWVPLVWGWVSPEEQVEAADGPPLPAETMPPVWADFGKQPAAKPAKEPEATQPWNQVVEWIEEDPETKPAGELAELRDPFQIPKEQVDTEESDEKEQEAAAAPKPVEVEISPAELGLTLSSTIVGFRRQSALINGRTYTKGETIEIDRDGRRMAFKLAEVQAWKVVLERSGKRYDLAIPRPASSGRIELGRKR